MSHWSTLQSELCTSKRPHCIGAKLLMDTDRLDPDLSEALSRGREPRKLWPVVHSIEDTTQRPPGWWESWPALLLIVAGAALAKC